MDTPPKTPPIAPMPPPTARTTQTTQLRITPKLAFEVIASTKLKDVDFTTEDFRNVYTEYAKSKGWDPKIPESTMVAIFDSAADSLQAIRYVETFLVIMRRRYRLSDLGKTAAETGNTVWNAALNTPNIAVDHNRKGLQILRDLVTALIALQTGAILARDCAKRALILSRSLPDTFSNNGPEVVCARMRQIVKHLFNMDEGQKHSDQYRSETSRVIGAVSSHVTELEDLFEVRTFDSPPLIISFSIPTDAHSAVTYGLNHEKTQLIIEEYLKVCGHDPEVIVTSEASVKHDGLYYHFEARGHNICMVLSEASDRIATFACAKIALDVEELLGPSTASTGSQSAACYGVVLELRRSLLAYKQQLRITIYHKYVDFVLTRISTIDEDVSGGQVYSEFQLLGSSLHEHYAVDLDGSQAGDFRTRIIADVCEIVNQHLTILVSRFPEVVPIT